MDIPGSAYSASVHVTIKPRGKRIPCTQSACLPGPSSRVHEINMQTATTNLLAAFVPRVLEVF
ncbi:hypothetical protein Mapa_015416 [Marchantia paleacea]|nr:hypothetical protein Mapa_015416 [Marchantia paleacea]